MQFKFAFLGIGFATIVDGALVTRVKLELTMNCEWWFEFRRVTRNKNKRSDEIEQITKNV